MTALDAPTQPRIARSRQRRCPAPPPRRPRPPRGVATVGVEQPDTVGRVAPTRTVVLPPVVDDDVEVPVRRSRRWLAVLAAALVAGLATGAGLAAAGIDVIPPSTAGPTPAQTLRAIQRLGSLQSAPQDVSATFTMDQSSFLDLAGSVKYQAFGQAQATIDLSAVTASDVRVRGAHVSVRIPAAQLDPPVVDDSRTGPVSRGRRALDAALGSDVSASDVQAQAQSHLSDAAQRQGVPAAVQQLAVARVRATLHRLGFVAPAVTVAGS